jgi:hypothetical protein
VGRVAAARRALVYGLTEEAKEWRLAALEELEHHLRSRLRHGPEPTPAELDAVEAFMHKEVLEKQRSFRIGMLVERAVNDRIHFEVYFEAWLR